MSLFKFSTLFASLGLAALAMAGAPQSAHADTMHPAGSQGLCLDVNTSRMDPTTHAYPVILYPCQNSWNQNFFTTAYGPQGFSGYCLDFGGGGGQGSPLVMAPCVAGKWGQIWSLVSDNSAPGALRNQSGWCIDIPYGNTSANVQPQAYGCKTGTDIRGRNNQTFTRGSMLTVTQVHQMFPQLSATQLSTIAAGGYITANGVIAAGGGNVIAAGGGNVIAAGGGNVIAAGGGNFVKADGGGMDK